MMDKRPSLKMRVVALLVMLFSAFHASFAQKSGSLPHAVPKSKGFQKIGHQRLTAINPPKKVESGLVVERFAVPVAKKLVAVVGDQKFVANVRFLPLKDRRIGQFIARPRTLLTKEEAWYTLETSDGRGRIVTVELQLPQNDKKSSVQPEFIIDVECEDCDKNGVTIVYEPTPPEPESVKSREIYTGFQREAAKSQPVVVKEIKNGGGSILEFTTSVGAMCTFGDVDGAVHFNADGVGLSSEHFYWQLPSDNKSKRYKADVGVDGQFRLVRWNSKNERVVCSRNLEDKIVLRVECPNACTAKHPVVYQPVKVEIPKDVSLSAVALLRSEYIKNGNIKVCHFGLDQSKVTFAQLRDMGDDMILRLVYGTSVTCTDKKDEYRVTLDEERNVHNLEAHLSNQIDAVSQYFWYRECLCAKLQGAIFRRVNWDSHADKKEKKSDVVPPKSVENSKEVLHVEAEHAATRFPKSQDEWLLLYTIRHPDIRCATQAITVTVRLNAEVNGDAKIVSSDVYEKKAFGRFRDTTWYDDTRILEITLQPQATESSYGNCAALEIEEVLPVHVNCHGCNKVIGNFEFTFGPSVSHIPAQPVSATSSDAIKGKLSTYRLTVSVHRDVLSRGRSAKFTAVLEVPSKKGSSDTSHFAARPRVLLTKEEAWYTEKDKNGMYLVYVAMQLPEKWEDGDQSPKIIIDVECDNCDPDRAQLRYLPNRPVWLTVKKQQVYTSFMNAKPQKSDASLQVTPSEAFEGHRKFEFAVEKKAFCSNPFGGGVVVKLTSATNEETFQWVRRLSSTIGVDTQGVPQEYDAEVGADSDGGRLVRFRTNNDEEDLCKQDSEANLLLRMTCAGECSVVNGSVMTYLPQQLEIPQGVSSEVVTQFSGSFSKEGEGSLSCDIVVEEGRSSVEALGKNAVYRLWHSAPEDCHEPLGSALRNLDARFAKDSNPLSQSIRTSECFCNGWQGRVYRLVDAGPVPGVKTGPPVDTPEHPVVNPGTPADTPEHPVVNPGTPVDTPEHPVVNPGPPVDTPEHPVVNPGPPVDTPEHPVVNPGTPVDTPEHPVVNPTGNHGDVTGSWRVETGWSHVSTFGITPEHGIGDDSNSSPTSAENGATPTEKDEHPPTSSPATTTSVLKDMRSKTERSERPEQITHKSMRGSSPVTDYKPAPKVSGSARISSNKVGVSNQDMSSVLSLLPHTTSGHRSAKGDMVFKNWVSQDRLSSNVPFVTMFCFQIANKSGTRAINSVSLGGKVQLESFPVSVKGLQCYAFNSCDGWRAFTNSVPPAEIVVTGTNVPEIVKWRVDEAVPFTKVSSEGGPVSLAGWYGPEQQRQRVKGVDGLTEAIVSTASPYECTIVSQSADGKSTNSRGGVSHGTASFIYVRPPYQLSSKQPRVAISGDYCHSFGINLFIAALVIAALHY